jgi:PAS domain S-box-containing protein
MDRTDAGGVVIVDSAEGAVRRVSDAGAREVVIGVDVDAPLTLARTLHAAHPDLLVTIHTRLEEEGRLDHALTRSPLALGALRCARAGEMPARQRRELSRRGPQDAWSAMEASPETALLVNGESLVLAGNPAAAALFGRQERDLIGVVLTTFFGEAERARLAAHLRNGGHQVYTATSGRPFDVISWRYPGGDPTLRIVMLREPSRTELEVRTQGQFLDAIIENIPNMVFVKEASGLRFVRFNRAGEELLGHDRSDLIGRNDYDFFPQAEADFFTQKDREVLLGGAVVDIAEERIHTRLGVRWLHTRKVPVLDEDGVPLYLLGISEDITAHKEAEEERARLIVELRRSNQELQQFASVASHDLQEPLRKVQMFGERLRAALGGSLPEEAADSIARMEGAAGRMQELIYGLLAYSRVTTRGQPFERVDLGGVLEDVVADLEVRMLQSGGTVDVGPLPTVLGDRTQMRQLFQNLVGNALKFHAPGVAPRIVVRGRAVGDERATVPMAEITVSDNGIGFDMGEVETIFQPFQRLHGRDRYEGTGMGLAICRRIVDRHGGTLLAASTPGEGATFTVRLKA